MAWIVLRAAQVSLLIPSGVRKEVKLPDGWIAVCPIYEDRDKAVKDYPGASMIEVDLTIVGT